MPRPAIDPVPWRPPATPPRARRTSGELPLPPTEIIQVGGNGPEDVLIAPDGTAYTGTDDGAIRRVSRRAAGEPGSTVGVVQVDVVADTGGRPLGLEWLPDGRLLVCDALRGLLAVELAPPASPDPVGESTVTELVTEVDGAPLTFCNNAAVDTEGTIWFSDSSARFGVEHWRADIFEHSGTGRLLRRDPDGSTHALVAGLQFPNGVALAPDASAVFFAETGAYRVSRLWLTGPQQGRTEVVLDNLPGFPDNISLGADGLIWVALASPRDRIVDLLAPAPPWLRRAAWAVPEVLQPKPKMFGWVQAFDPSTGAVVHDLQGRRPGFGMSTGVREHQGQVWLSSLVGTTLATFTLP